MECRWSDHDVLQSPVPQISEKFFYGVLINVSYKTHVDENPGEYCHISDKDRETDNDPVKDPFASLLIVIITYVAHSCLLFYYASAKAYPIIAIDHYRLACGNRTLLFSKL